MELAIEKMMAEMKRTFLGKIITTSVKVTPKWWCPKNPLDSGYL